MPEPVTNAQIEDVLSSIRRLVSEDSTHDARVMQPSKPSESAAPQDAARTGKLVLTPALRVEEDEIARPDQASHEAAPSADPQMAWSDPAATLLGAARPEEAGDAQGDNSGDAASVMAEDRQGEDADQVAPEAIAEDSAAAALDLPETEAETGDEVADAGTADRFAPDAALSDTEASDLEGPASEEMAGEGADDAAQDLPTFHSSRAESLSAKIEALEAVIGRTRDQWEPDGTSDDAYAGTPVETLAWRDASEADEAPEPAAAPAEPEAQRTAEPTTDDLAADEAVIDEDSLRELVAEIVRQELQGALGERITRNVRKLVRREIHRALAAQDLE